METATRPLMEGATRSEPVQSYRLNRGARLKASVRTVPAVERSARGDAAGCHGQGLEDQQIGGETGQGRGGGNARRPSQASSASFRSSSASSSCSSGKEAARGGGLEGGESTRCDTEGPLPRSISASSCITDSKRLQQAVAKLSNVKRFTQRGTRESHTQRWLHRLRQPRPETLEQQEFTAKVLRSPVLMSRSARILQAAGNSPAWKLPSTGNGADAAGCSLLADVANILHDMKISTANVCWTDNVLPLRRELAVMTERHSIMVNKFKEVRASYLKEITTLRDAARARTDPLENVDVAYFLEPTQMLMDQTERKFVLDIVREVFKMLVESNPQNTMTVNLNQVMHLVDKVQNKEVQELQKGFLEKTSELQAVRKELEELTKSSCSLPCSGSGDNKATAAQVQTGIDELRTQLWEERSQRTREQQRCEDLEQSLETCRKQCKALVSTLQQERLEVQRGHCKQEDEEEDEGGERSSHQALPKSLASEWWLQREWRLSDSHQPATDSPASQQSAYSSSATLPAAGEECLEGAAGESRLRGRSIGSRAWRSEPRNALQQHRRRLLVDGPALECDATAEVTSHKSDASTADDSFGEDEEEEVDTDLWEHFPSLHADEVVEDAERVEDLLEYAAALGCQVQRDLAGFELQPPQSKRSCKCGHELAQDDTYCPRCGEQWQSAAGSGIDICSDGDAEALKLQATVLCYALQMARAELRREADSREASDFKAFNEANVDGYHISSRAEQLQELVKHLQREHRNIEAKLLARRFAQYDGFVEDIETVETASNAPCHAKSKGQLRTARRLVRRFQAFCGKLADALTAATVENSNMGMTLSHIPRALREAARTLRESSAENSTSTEKFKEGINAVTEITKQCSWHEMHEERSAEEWKKRDVWKRELVHRLYEALSVHTSGPLLRPSDLNKEEEIRMKGETHHEGAEDVKGKSLIQTLAAWGRSWQSNPLQGGAQHSFSERRPKQHRPRSLSHLLGGKADVPAEEGGSLARPEMAPEEPQPSSPTQPTDQEQPVSPGIVVRSPVARCTSARVRRPLISKSSPTPVASEQDQLVVQSMTLNGSGGIKSMPVAPLGRKAMLLPEQPHSPASVMSTLSPKGDVVTLPSVPPSPTSVRATRPSPQPGHRRRSF